MVHVMGVLLPDAWNIIFHNIVGGLRTNLRLLKLKKIYGTAIFPYFRCPGSKLWELRILGILGALKFGIMRVQLNPVLVAQTVTLASWVVMKEDRMDVEPCYPLFSAIYMHICEFFCNRNILSCM